MMGGDLVCGASPVVLVNNKLNTDADMMHGEGTAKRVGLAHEHAATLA
jgi:hypothetical protein